MCALILPLPYAAQKLRPDSVVVLWWFWVIAAYALYDLEQIACSSVITSRMAAKHPHAEASYRIVFLADKGYGVEVSIPDTSPTTVTSFATEQEAERWIAGHS